MAALPSKTLKMDRLKQAAKPKPPPEKKEDPKRIRTNRKSKESLLQIGHDEYFTVEVVTPNSSVLERRTLETFENCPDDLVKKCLKRHKVFCHADKWSDTTFECYKSLGKTSGELFDCHLVPVYDRAGSLVLTKIMRKPTANDFPEGLVKAVNKMHANGIVHGNIRAEYIVGDDHRPGLFLGGLHHLHKDTGNEKAKDLDDLARAVQQL